MTSRERETQAAVAALVHRLQNRGDGEGQFATDDKPFALEYVTALIGFGWRPFEAVRDTRSQPAGEKGPVSEETRHMLEEARQVAAEASARRRADGEARRTEGDAA
jgi:hypothetical protein